MQQDDAVTEEQGGRTACGMIRGGIMTMRRRETRQKQKEMKEGKMNLQLTREVESFTKRYDDVCSIKTYWM